MVDKTVSVYFADGKRTIDFILVYKKNVLELHPNNLRKFRTFTTNLEKLGLFLESEPFEADNNVVFVKIHANDASVFLYSDLCNVNLASKTLAYRPTTKPPWKFLATPLTRPDPNDPIYQRAPESVSSAIPKNITSAERILVIQKLLVRVKFGELPNEYGISKLVNENVIIDYFPIHDGPHDWTDSGALSDRQLLARYWGMYKMWNKQQPLHLVEKYYGPAFAFYFAWMDLYIKMLILPAILSICVVIYGIITLNTDENLRSKEICKSDLLMCPRCHFSKCKFEVLRSTCTMSNIAYVFDNFATYMFAIFISIWSTVFTELWQRRESILRLQWNLRDVEHETTTRPAFFQTAKKTKYSPVTDSEEPFISIYDRCAKYSFTFVIVILALLLVLLAVVGVMIYRITVNTILLSRKQTEIITKNRQIIASSTGALMSASFIIAFKQVFKKVSLWLTELEDHRTQYEFDNAYVYKVYGFEFVNNYAAPMYIAFFKGRFFTHPGDLKVWKAYGGLGSDYCDTSGCTLDLCVQLFTIMAVKTLFSNITQYVNPIIQKKLQICLKRVSRHTQLPFYQEEFIKPKTDYFFLIDEYVEQVILYGFVVFFIAAFPLAPLLAFATCVGELRTDASKITRNYRRPIPQRVTGLGAWLVILQAVTYVGVVTNAFMIAFTSNVVDFEVYRLHWFSTGGFHNTTISAFDIRDFVFFETKQVQEWCYYPGRRYPPDHPRKYQVTTDYWFMLGLRFSVVVIFEHILMVIKGILAYAIPDIPNRVLVELAKEKRKEISA